MYFLCLFLTSFYARHMRFVEYVISETFIYLQNRNNNTTIPFFNGYSQNHIKYIAMSKALYKYVAPAVSK